MVAAPRQAIQQWYTFIFWTRIVKALIIMLITVFTLAGCGQSGPLRPAPDAEATEASS